MNKAVLVAQREYVENLKTKTFWIGILAFPVMLSLMILVPMWLESKKDVRKYAVIDQSGWLTKAVDDRAHVADGKVYVRFFKSNPAALRKILGLAPSHEGDEKKAETSDSTQAGSGHGSDAQSTKDQDQSRDHAAASKSDKEKIVDWLTLFSEDDDDAVEVRARFFATMSAARAAGTSDLPTDKEPERVNNPKDGTNDLTAVTDPNVLTDLQKTLSDYVMNLPAAEARKISNGLSISRFAREEVSAADIADAQAVTSCEEALKRRLEKGELFAYIVINKNPELVPSKKKKEGDSPEDSSQDEKQNVEGTSEKSVEPCKYVSNNLTDDSLKNWFTSLATECVRKRRIDDAAIPPKVAKDIQEPLVFLEKKVGKTGAEEEVTAQDEVRQWAPVAFVYLLWISVFTVAQMLLTNTVEEKSNRIIEVLLSSVSPIQLMIGKIAGIAATGLTVLGSWVFFFFIGTTMLPKLLGKPLPFDLSIILRDPVYLSSFVCYFFLGYLLFAAILVGMGSVCNSLKEAQNLLQPVFILLIVPILAMMPIGKDPNGTLAKVMSYIPPFTPFVMMNRAAGPPTTFEYVTTTILLVVSILGAMWFAAKIFRIGVLMTGKPPKLREILSWLKAPVGAVPIRKEE